MRFRLLAGLLLASSAASAAQPPARNLVLIVVDGLRADRCGVYGYGRDTTPILDARAKGAVVFDRAFSQESWTLPSFTTLFSSRYPEEHGILSHSRAVPPELLTLPRVLRESGRRTAGFAGGHYLDPEFGLSRGFDLYRSGGMGVWRFFGQTAPQAAAWIRAHGDRPFFVFLHGNDMHPPFDLPDEVEGGGGDDALPDYAFVLAYNRKAGDRGRFPDGATPPRDWFDHVDAFRADPRGLERLSARYDARLRGVDRALDEVFRTLRETGHDKDTVVILTADHGFELGEKGKLATAFHATVFNTVLRVPLLLWAPGLAARRVAEPVQLVDLAPTALELLGLAVPSAFHGRSFAGLARGEAARGPRYAFGASSVLTDPANSLQLESVQDKRWKLIYAPASRKAELFDLERDPLERHALAPKGPEAAALSKALSGHLGRPL